MEVFRSSNFKIFFNHGEEDHSYSVKLKRFGCIHVIKFQNFLQPWWRISLKKCEIKAFWRHSDHQISKCSSFWIENVLYLSYFLSILSYIVLYFLKKCPIFCPICCYTPAGKPAVYLICYVMCTLLSNCMVSGENRKSAPNNLRTNP